MGLSLSSINRGLFGGSTSSSNSSSFINPDQSRQLSNLYGYAGNLFGQFQSNPQSLIAGFTQPQIQGQQAAIDAAAGPLSGLVGQGNQAIGQALNADPSQSPYFASALQASFNPFIRNFMTNVLPGIRSQAVGVGRVGSGREGIAQGLASQGLLQQLGDITAQMGNNAYNTGLQSRINALGLLPQIGQFNLAPSQVQQTIGGQQQALNQQYAMAPFQLGSLYQGLLGNPTILNQTSSTSQSANGGLADLAGIGAAANGLPSGQSMFSGFGRLFGMG